MVSSVPPALKESGDGTERTLESIEKSDTTPMAVAEERRREEGCPVRGYFTNIYRAVTSIFEGLTVTKSWMFRRPFTIQYPDKIEKPVQEMLPRTYRGILEVDLDLCTGCSLCSRNCPIGTISLNVAKNAETGVREITKFDIDIGQCMYCGICVEACKFDALANTTEFEASVGCPDDLVLHFVKEPVPVAKYKPGQAPMRMRPGTILAQVIPPFGKRKPVYQPEPRPERPAAPEPAAKPEAAAKPELEPIEKAETKPEPKPGPGEEPEK